MKNRQITLGFASIVVWVLLSFRAISCNDDYNSETVTPVASVVAPDANFNALADNNTILTYNT